MVKKTDWQIIEMPKETTSFKMTHNFSPEDMELIKQGHKPESMDDRWFMYFEDNQLYCHRSWTGTCVYILDFSKPEEITVIVNQHPDQTYPDFLRRMNTDTALCLLGMLLGRSLV